VRWVKPQPAGTAKERPTVPPKAPIAEQADSPDELPVIPGLDTAIGLKRAMGKKTFYLDMLRMYVDNQGEIPAQIRKSLADGDYETAQRLAHTAKGVSGNIGATEVQELAARVEKSFRERDSCEMIEQLISELAAGHGKLIGGLKEMLRSLNAGAEENAEVLQVDRERAVAACKKLEQLLANADGEATDFLNEERDLFRGFLGSDPFQMLKKAIDDYDFEQAMEVLKKRVNESAIASE
jgi:two-component system, sensor histidine kinase and response regulator